jgi:hypothetical protein
MSLLVIHAHNDIDCYQMIEVQTHQESRNVANITITTVIVSNNGIIDGYIQMITHFITFALIT